MGHNPRLGSITFLCSINFPQKIQNIHCDTYISGLESWTLSDFSRINFSNPEVKPPTVFVVVMNLTSAHSEPCSPLLLILVNWRLILLWLQTPCLFSLFHNFGGEGRGDGVSLHHAPGPHSPGKMLKSTSNSFGMTTPPIVLPGPTTKEIMVEVMFSG